MDLVLSGPSGGSYNPVFAGGTPCCRMPPIPILSIPILLQGVKNSFWERWEKQPMGTPMPLLPHRVT